MGIGLPEDIVLVIVKYNIAEIKKLSRDIIDNMVITTLLLMQNIRGPRGSLWDKINKIVYDRMELLRIPGNVLKKMFVPSKHGKYYKIHQTWSNEVISHGFLRYPCYYNTDGLLLRQGCFAIIINKLDWHKQPHALIFYWTGVSVKIDLYEKCFGIAGLIYKNYDYIFENAIIFDSTDMTPGVYVNKILTATGKLNLLVNNGIPMSDIIEYSYLLDPKSAYKLKNITKICEICNPDDST